MKSKTDWQARLDCEKPLQIKTLEKSFAGIPSGATMLIVIPKMVDEAVKLIPVGQTIDQKVLRKQLAEKFQADYACPVTTGISLRVVAEAAYARIVGGVNPSEVSPFWRAVDPSSDLAGKLACGRDFIVTMRNKG
ncbi:MAG: hypothetical protein KGR46_09010 [Verrucomicrobia bacterium]|nr:hypothetical protein [Verrucomicrobiota bacterium]